MNLFVADPDWGWWIIGYFYLGGIAAGAYFFATLVEIAGSEEDRVLARAGFRLAFPLVAVCGLFLTLDLERPERFWHMLLQSEHYLPILKPWSPMSIGAWALFLFGGGAFVSFLATFWPQGRLARLLHSRPWGLIYHAIGCLIGFFIAAYTGVLLTASNQPVWSDSEWIGALFLTSAASTGMAAVLLLNHRRRHQVSADSLERLERADLWAVGLELAAFMIFLASLGGALVPALATWPGRLLLFVALPVGVLIPLAIHLAPGLAGHWRAPAAAVCALAGGLVVRYAMVMLPQALLTRGENIPQNLVGRPLWESWQGVTLLVCTCVLALLVVFGVVRRFHFSLTPVLAAGGTALATAVMVFFFVSAPLAEVRVFPSLEGLSISPEDGRPRGGGVGASAQNRPEPKIRPRSKIPEWAGP